MGRVMWWIVGKEEKLKKLWKEIDKLGFGNEWDFKGKGDILGRGIGREKVEMMEKNENE